MPKTYPTIAASGHDTRSGKDYQVQTLRHPDTNRVFGFEVQSWSHLEQKWVTCFFTSGGFDLALDKLREYCDAVASFMKET